MVLLDGDVEAKRAEVRAEQLEQESDGYRRERKACVEIAGELNEALEQAAVLIAKLEGARARADDRLAAARELADDRFYRPDGEHEDEPVRPAGLEQLIEAITAGPRRPVAQAERERKAVAEQRARDQWRLANEIVALAGELPAGSRRREEMLDRLDEPLRAETLERLDARRAEIRAGQERLGVRFERQDDSHTIQV